MLKTCTNRSIVSVALAALATRDGAGPGSNKGDGKRFPEGTGYLGTLDEDGGEEEREREDPL